jgi:ATP-dependent exoDNAse (exonuclease V) beta subunit
MTRAMERLLVSGSVGPAGEGSEETPIGWTLARLGLEDVGRSGAVAPVEVERGPATVVVRVDTGESGSAETTAATAAHADAALATETVQLALFEGSGEALPPPAPRLRELTVVPEPPLHRVTRLSFSALALFERCSYRYYAERVAGMQPTAWSDGGRDGNGDGERHLHATEIGDAVHRLLELVDLARPAVPDGQEDLVRSWYPTVTDGEVEHVTRLVRAYCDSALAARIASLDDVQVERPFAFVHDGVLLNGRLDVLWQSGSHALVLDYKTNVLDGRDPAEIVEAEYVAQRTVYALACLRAGADEVEVVYQFLEAPEAVVSSSYTCDDVAALEAELGAAIARIQEGEFRPTPSAYACSGCPALARVCAGPDLGTLSDERPLPELTSAG